MKRLGFFFRNFNRLGVLEPQFYADDKTFDARKQLAPDPVVRDHFNAALAQQTISLIHVEPRTRKTVMLCLT